MTQTTKKVENPCEVITPVFRAEYPTLWEPRAVEEGQKKKYSVRLRFRIKLDPKEPLEEVADLAKINAAIIHAAFAKFGNDKSKWPTKNIGTATEPNMVSALRFPLRAGAEKDLGDDIVFFNANSFTRPYIVDQQVKPIASPEGFFGGCYGMASLRAYGYSVAGNKGVTFELLGIQKVRDGEPLSSRKKPEEEFAAIAMPEGEGAPQGAAPQGAAPQGAAVGAPAVGAVGGTTPDPTNPFGN